MLEVTECLVRVIDEKTVTAEIKNTIHRLNDRLYRESNMFPCWGVQLRESQSSEKDKVIESMRETSRDKDRGTSVSTDLTGVPEEKN